MGRGDAGLHGGTGGGQVGHCLLAFGLVKIGIAIRGIDRERAVKELDGFLMIALLGELLGQSVEHKRVGCIGHEHLLKFVKSRHALSYERRCIQRPQTLSHLNTSTTGHRPSIAPLQSARMSLAGSHFDPSPLLADLTPPQQAAVLHTTGPLLVLAGPGSGKTRVITRRIAHLVGIGVPPWQILAVTFTNKAAAEMRHRVAAVLGDEFAARGLTVATFHSLCVRLLRRYSDLAAQHGCPVVKAGFSVYDADDQASLVKKAIAERRLATSNFPPRTVLSAISNAKNDLLDAAKFMELAADFYQRTVAKVYEVYQRMLGEASAVDFDDLLMLTAKMLRQCEPVRAEVRRRYRFLMVDEYQDTNKAQFAIASLIAGDDPGLEAAEQGARVPNICVVGDPDQSIYGWRGADISNILDFEKTFPMTKVIALGENFRSLAPILSAADRLIQHNRKRKHKPLIAMRKPATDGGAATPGVEVSSVRDEHHEAALVLDWIGARREDGFSLSDMAVFYRNNSLSRVMEDSLRRAGVPYHLVRGTAFFDREEVKHALGYLRVVANPADGVSLARVVNTPARGISDATWDKIEQASTQHRVTAMEVMRRPHLLAALTKRALESIGKFVVMVDEWAGIGSQGFLGSREESLDEPAADGALAQLVERVVRESGLEQMYSGEEDRRENLSELVSSAREFEDAFRAGAIDSDIALPAPFPPSPPASDSPPPSDVAAGETSDDPLGGLDIDAALLPADDASPLAGTGPSLVDLLRGYLERVALVSDTDAIDPAIGAVTLMTLHAAKGLEYRAVCMIGLEEGLLPHSRSADNEAALEEERRLCFVGITRAMDRLLLTSATYRTIRGVPERQIASRFIEEIRGEGVTFTDGDDPMGFDEDDHRDDEFADFVRGGRKAGFQSKSGGSEGDSSDNARGLSIGMNVRHPQFGVGKIEAVSRGIDPKVRVKFSVGVKTLVLQYARLERV